MSDRPGRPPSLPGFAATNPPDGYTVPSVRHHFHAHANISGVATMMDSDPQFEKFTEDAITSWGGPGYGFDQLAAGIEALYRARLKFPPAWPPHRRAAFVTAHAHTAATEVGTLFDDLLDTARDDYARDNSCLLDAESASDLIRAARRAALDDVKLSATYDLPEQIAAAAAADPARGKASMTACGPAQRPPTTTVRLQHRRARQRP